ncbi:MAG: hypothetical protein KJ626_08565 [Verrucomicrobia bacterium]|nr:hypothetical protein [Verrucomicrobiota bacterium]
MSRVSRWSVALMAALSIALSSGCATGGSRDHVGDTILREASSRARTAMNAGRLDEARRFYVKALNRAREMDDPGQVGRLGTELAGCEILIGRYTRAEARLAEAISALQRSEQSTAEARLLEAEAPRRRGHFERARALADHAATEMKESDGRSVRSKLYLFNAELACDVGDPIAARTELSKLKALENPVRSDLIAASLYRCDGRIHYLEGSFNEAFTDFDLESMAYRKLGMYGEMARALARAGDALSAAGNHAASCEYRYRAARSLYAGGDYVSALKLVEKALPEAHGFADRDFRRRLMILFEEIRQAVK